MPNETSTATSERTHCPDCGKPLPSEAETDKHDHVPCDECKAFCWRAVNDDECVEERERGYGLLLTDREIRNLSLSGTDGEIPAFRAGFRVRIMVADGPAAEEAWEIAERYGAPEVDRLAFPQVERVSWQRGWMAAHAMLAVLVADPRRPSTKLQIAAEDRFVAAAAARLDEPPKP